MAIEMCNFAERVLSVKAVITNHHKVEYIHPRSDLGQAQKFKYSFVTLVHRHRDCVWVITYDKYHEKYYMLSKECSYTYSPTDSPGHKYKLYAKHVKEFDSEEEAIMYALIMTGN